MRFVDADNQLVKEIVGRLTVAIRPARVIVFGSAAARTAGADRDIDPLVHVVGGLASPAHRYFRVWRWRRRLLRQPASARSRQAAEFLSDSDIRSGTWSRCSATKRRRVQVVFLQQSVR